MRINLKNIEDFMLRNGLSERQLARSMGVSHSYVFRVLRGDRQAGGKFIGGLVKAGMPPQDIFFTNTVTNS